MARRFLSGFVDVVWVENRDIEAVWFRLSKTSKVPGETKLGDAPVDVYQTAFGLRLDWPDIFAIRLDYNAMSAGFMFMMLQTALVLRLEVAVAFEVPTADEDFGGYALVTDMRLAGPDGGFPAEFVQS